MEPAARKPPEKKPPERPAARKLRFDPPHPRAVRPPHYRFGKP